MLNWMKLVIISLVVVGITLAIIFTPTGCVTRSPLISDSSTPLICKLPLECYYNCQSSDVCMAACVTKHERSCDKFLIKLDCINQFPISKSMTEKEIYIAEKNRADCRLSLQ